MTATLPSLANLKPNPAWASLPLFDRTAWKRVAFGAFAENIGERAEPKDAQEEIYVGLEHLDPQCLHIRRWGKGSDVIGSKLRFRKGDIIFGKRRAYQRKLAVAEFDGICSAHAMVVRARPDMVLPEFLPFLMMSDRFMNRAVEISVGSLSPTINWSTLKLEIFDLPPLEQQRRVAEILWAVDEVARSNLQLAIAAKTAANEKIDSIASAPETRMSPLGELITDGPQNGLYRPGTDYGNGTAIMRIDSFYDGRIVRGTELKRVRVEDEISERYRLRNGDILINRVNSIDFVGKCAFVEGLEEDTLFESNIMRFRVDEDTIDPRFAIRWMCRDAFRKHIVGRAKQAVNQASVNQDDLRAAPIPVPSRAIQANLLSSILSLESVENAAIQCGKNASSLSTAILNQILSP